MPADNPLQGEIWTLPNQPSLTTSGEGGRAIVETVEERTRIVRLISELQGRRIVVPERSFLITWSFVYQTPQNVSCSHIGCQNIAWFNQEDPYCFQHFTPNERVDFWAPGHLHCPLNRGHNEPTSIPFGHITIWSCSTISCRTEWVTIPRSKDKESLIRRVLQATQALEERGLTVRIRMGSEAYDLIHDEVIGASWSKACPQGNPPQLQGIPLYVIGQDGVCVIGTRQTDVTKRIQQFGSSRPEVPTYTNAMIITPTTNLANLAPGAKWWHKTQHEPAFILEITTADQKLHVRYRQQGIVQRLPFEDFSMEFQVTPPTPPCKIDEEWVDSQGNNVTIVELEDQGAIVQATTGSTYLLPYKQFNRWKKIERRSIYDRLMDED